ncbi:MAG: hypothetical protein GY749_22035 [Desulfobacteraceae bacterium]|nr:hypothetical protein [Desulfobacteraceae bacterium]
MIFKEWTDIQRRVFIDTIQVYEAFTDTFRKNSAYRGGMHWKKSKAKEYLFRTRDRLGNGKSLGPRSSETEKIMAEFQKGKQDAKERLAKLKGCLAEQARFCKAAMIQRVPRLVAAILRLLDQENILGKNIIVVGTSAMFGYEANAGVFLDSQIMATRDIDILWDTRTALKLFGDQAVKNNGLMGILQKADRSFEPLYKRGFRAVNSEGFMVDLIKPDQPWHMIQKKDQCIGSEGDLEAAEVRNLQWLVSAPKFFQTIIGDDGYPAAIAAPDHRAFALHKLWLSEQPDREPVKKQRDYDQGVTIAGLVAGYLPNYPFKKSELRMFPNDVIKRAKQQISESEMPVGFDFED